MCVCVLIDIDLPWTIWTKVLIHEQIYRSSCWVHDADGHCKLHCHRKATCKRPLWVETLSMAYGFCRFVRARLVSSFQVAHRNAAGRHDSVSACDVRCLSFQVLRRLLLLLQSVLTFRGCKIVFKTWNSCPTLWSCPKDSHYYPALRILIMYAVYRPVCVRALTLEHSSCILERVSKKRRFLQCLSMHIIVVVCEASGRDV